MKVGTIDSIEPIGTQAKMTLHVNRRVSVPADAKAVIVAQNLISARYVQLAPAYESGPTMGDGAVIPLDRTAIPVEWDEVKEQLMRLATELGPDKGMSTGSVGRFIDSAANALDGNGDKLRQTLAQLSGVGRILADGSGNIVDTITNLQTFVTALRDSNDQIVQFQDRFATLTSVVDDSRSDLDAALTNLSDVVGETQRFIEGTRDKTAEQIQRLGNVTQNLADHRMDLENVLHIAPHSIANAVNMFDPRTGAASGVFVLNNLTSPVWAICTHDRRARERHVARDRQALRAVRSARRCDSELQLSADSVNPFLTVAIRRTTCFDTPRTRLDPGTQDSHLRRRRPARGVRVHRARRRHSTAPGLRAAPWPTAPGAAAQRACRRSRPPPTLQDMLLPAEAPPPPRRRADLPPPDGTPP